MPIAGSTAAAAAAEKRRAGADSPRSAAVCPRPPSPPPRCSWRHPGAEQGVPRPDPLRTDAEANCRGRRAGPSRRGRAATRAVRPPRTPGPARPCPPTGRRVCRRPTPRICRSRGAGFRTRQALAVGGAVRDLFPHLEAVPDDVALGAVEPVDVDDLAVAGEPDPRTPGGRCAGSARTAAAKERSVASAEKAAASSSSTSSPWAARISSDSRSWSIRPAASAPRSSSRYPRTVLAAIRRSSLTLTHPRTNLTTTPFQPSGVEGQ